MNRSFSIFIFCSVFIISCKLGTSSSSDAKDGVDAAAEKRPSRVEPCDMMCDGGTNPSAIIGVWRQGRRCSDQNWSCRAYSGELPGERCTSTGLIINGDCTVPLITRSEGVPPPTPPVNPNGERIDTSCALMCYGGPDPLAVTGRWRQGRQCAEQNRVCQSDDHDLPGGVCTSPGSIAIGSCVAISASP